MVGSFILSIPFILSRTPTDTFTARESTVTRTHIGTRTIILGLVVGAIAGVLLLSTTRPTHDDVVVIRS